MSRILVTGSRDWSDRGAILGALWDAWRARRGEPITLVHGACPTGADAMADEIWSEYNSAHPVERHPADWSKGRKAGPERNAYMVSLGADLCLAFIDRCTSPRCHRSDPHDSHGATGCANLAEKAGIPVVRIRPTTPAPTSGSPA